MLPAFEFFPSVYWTGLRQLITYFSIFKTPQEEVTPARSYWLGRFKSDTESNS